jgi:hypothetical protein
VACRCASEAVSAYRRPVPIDIGVGANCLTIERWRRGPTHWVIICALVGTKLRRDQLVRSACRERNEPLARQAKRCEFGLDGGSAIFRHFKLNPPRKLEPTNLTGSAGPPSFLSSSGGSVGSAPAYLRPPMVVASSTWRCSQPSTLVGQSPGGPTRTRWGFVRRLAGSLMDEVSAQVGGVRGQTPCCWRRTDDIFAGYWPHQRRDRHALQQRPEVRRFSRQA